MTQKPLDLCANPKHTPVKMPPVKSNLTPPNSSSDLLYDLRVVLHRLKWMETRAIRDGQPHNAVSGLIPRLKLDVAYVRGLCEFLDD